MEKGRFSSFLQAFHDPTFKFQNMYSGECTSKRKEFAYIILVFFYIPKRLTDTNICLDAQEFQLIGEHILSLETFLPPPLFKKKIPQKKKNNKNK